MLLVQILERVVKQAPADRKRRWDEKWRQATLDWEVALKLVMPDVIQLFRWYEQKVKRP
jgi:hypothetical protein